MLSWVLITLVIVQFPVLQACVYHNMIIVALVTPIVVKAAKMVDATLVRPVMMVTHLLHRMVMITPEMEPFTIVSRESDK
jgi:hypothetical protein